MSCMVEGDPNAPILVVAMAPGTEEIKSDSPLVGASGRLFWSCAERAGFTRADCYIVNTIGEIQEEGSSPSDRQFDKYWTLFDAAISESRAGVAICLGADAFWRLTGNHGGILDWRGYVLEPTDIGSLCRSSVATVPYKTSGRGHKKGDPRIVKVKTTLQPIIPPSVRYVFPTVHPSYVMRTGFKSVAVLAYDIARAKRGLDGQLAFSDLTFDTHVNPVGGVGEPVSIDIETTRSLQGQDFINRIGVSSRAGTWTVPWSQEAKEATKAVLEEGRLIVGHNLSYDLPRLKAAGVTAKGPIYDTMFACQALQPDLAKGLNFVASLYLDTKRWKHRAEEDPELYNALDVAQTYRLYEITKEQIEKTGQMDMFKTMMAGLPVLMDMTERGLKLDPARRSTWIEQLKQQEAILWKQWDAFHPTVSISSNAQLKVLFYKTLGWKTQRNDDGKPSTDEAAVKKLLELYSDPSLNILLAWRKINHLRTTYAEVGNFLWGDGLIHPSYISTAKDKDEKGKGMAGTGRIQARNPNIMNVPQEGRKLYIPHSPGNILIEFDYDQAELRVVAAVSGDEVLMARLDGPDIHQVHADMWGCTRKEAKNVTYATIYGAGKEKLQQMFLKYGIKRTQKECEVLLTKFYGTYPTVRAWREQIIAQVGAERMVRNPFGRVRYFWNPSKDVPAALDFIPQSTVADIMWSSLPVVNEVVNGMGGHLLTIVHDSYLFEVPVDKLGEATKRLETVLTRSYSNVSPSKPFCLPVSHRVGPSWGELQGETKEELEVEVVL
jgi:uracil-DNA glycosylase family 4